MTEASGERFKPPKANSKHFAQAMNDASEGLSAHITGVKFQCACIHILSTLSSKTPLQCHTINRDVILFKFKHAFTILQLYWCAIGNDALQILHMWNQRQHLNKICRLLVSIPQVPTCQACHRPLAWRVSAYIYIILHGHVTHLYKQMYVSTAM